ncbi:bifunctional hydroxymethylpyrimidine kinase/phosphomethylpyrimidine kinase [bacterium]|nr:bifunctional hydroxymethylpyrimidine kinase/phosphomethylpyrimidine kinase [bacterium]MBU1651735.1 bifunctional hydroxymethylpyrimidine kinase/phosphomethylpyrimidine kinase [bacterium]
MCVLVVGSAALDSVKTPFGEVTDALGGSAFFFAAAASFFTEVRIVGVVGEDFPMEKIEFLKTKNVDFKGLEVAPGKTFRWSGVYHENMNARDTLSTDLNVFETFSPKLPDEYKQTPYVFLANIHPELQLDVLAQIENPRLVALDTMNLWINISLAPLKEVLKKIDVVILNDEEARMLTGEHNLIKAAKAVTRLGPKTVIVKKGEHGAFYISGDDFFSLPAYPIEGVFDPTGAGDTFAAGTIGYLARENDISPAAMRKALVYGTVTASFTVEKFSVDRMKDLTFEEIQSRYDYMIKMTQF